MTDLKSIIAIPAKTGSTIDISSTQNEVLIVDIGGICCLYRKVLRRATGNNIPKKHVRLSEQRT